MTEDIDHWASYFDHNFMRWFDLKGKPALMRICSVDRKVELTLPGGAKTRKPVVTMEQVKGSMDEPVKPLVLNVTNANAIASIYGNSVSKWIGKEVVLFETKRPLRGKEVEAIGVRAPKHVKGE